VYRTIQNSLKSGERGPTLLEDFVLREKIFHFDPRAHPRTHCPRTRFGRARLCRGNGRHLRSVKGCVVPERREDLRCFTRFSTVAGGAGSVDTPRDVRGFAVKFYTSEGNWDLVGNNIPVFFIQDAIKFPDLVHAVKMESDRGYPQAGSAHDTFWDWASLMPETTHMLMWAMSDRAIPARSGLWKGSASHFPAGQCQWEIHLRQIPLEAQARPSIHRVG